MNWIAIGAGSGFLSVAAGAFGAHALAGRLEPRMLVVFETAARYQMFHALALLALGVWLRSEPRLSRAPAARIAGWSFALGTVLFSGSLYALALTGIRGLGAITPVGGLAFLVGWATLGTASVRK